MTSRSSPFRRIPLQPGLCAFLRGVQVASVGKFDAPAPVLRCSPGHLPLKPVLAELRLNGRADRETQLPRHLAIVEARDQALLIQIAPDEDLKARAGTHFQGQLRWITTGTAKTGTAKTGTA